MNKYCVIARNFKTPFIKRLSEEVGDVVLLHDPFSEDWLPQAHIYFFRSSAVHGSDRDLEALKQIPADSRVFNPESALRKFRNKRLQYENSLGNPFSAIPWFDLTGKGISEAMAFIHQHGEVVVKPIRGQQGWGVERLNASSLENWWERRMDDDYLLQKYLPGSEYRLFFIKDEYFLLSRMGEGVAANYAQGGGARLGEIPGRLRTLAEACIRSSGAVYGALDLIFYEGEYYFLELNLAPGIEQIETVSGQNILRKLLGALNSAT